MSLNDQQQKQLLAAINPSRVKKLSGMSHLEAWDVRAHLNRIFGFGGWSADLIDLVMLYEADHTIKSNGRPAYKVAYRATVRLTIHATQATYTEAAVGEAIMPDFKRGDAHDMAIKTAESQALKRCAVNLGDQFGLSLYDSGNELAVVRATLAGVPVDAESEPAPAETAVLGDLTAGDEVGVEGFPEGVPVDRPVSTEPHDDEVSLWLDSVHSALITVYEMDDHKARLEAGMAIQKAARERNALHIVLPSGKTVAKAIDVAIAGKVKK